MRFNHNLASALAFALPAFSLAPLLEDFGPGTMVIPNQFIVKLKNDTSTAAADEVWSLMSTVDYVYNATSFKGFSGTIDDTALAAILNHPAVEYTERDTIVFANSYVSQHGASWGLGRISHRGPQSFTDNTTYVYDDSAGEGVCVYVIDSGIRLDHEEFEGRAEFLINYSQGGEDEDTDGHGTHVAGTIGGKTYGVAKKVRLYAVKVLCKNCSPDAKSGLYKPSGPSKVRLGQSARGVASGIVMGMEFVLNNKQTRHCPNGTVVNMSVGVEPHSRSMNDVARDMFNEGIFVAVSAGNKGKNTNSTSPASEPSICTVGATDSNNQMAEFSNVGPVVDILAPGVDVLSASNENTTASMISSGTSMAAPHVAGLAACLLASGHKDPKTLCEYMAKTASPLRTVVSNDTISLVAFNGNPEG